MKRNQNNNEEIIIKRGDFYVYLLTSMLLGFLIGNLAIFATV